MIEGAAGKSKGGRNARRGVAALEFGLAVPLLVILVTAIVEIGYTMYQAMQVAYAAEAGIGAAQKYGWKQSKIERNAAAASSLGGVTATATNFCACPSASGLTTVTCGSTCSGSATAGQYIKVSVSATRQSILGTSVFGLPSTFQAAAILRQN